AERPRTSTPPPQFGASINLAMDPESTRRLADLPALSDPTLFALPSLQGFSGAAWLTFAPLQHKFTDWSEQPRWLEMETSSLGRTFLEFVSTNTASALLLADEPMPSLPNTDLTPTNAPVATRSEVRLEGDL